MVSIELIAFVDLTATNFGISTQHPHHIGHSCVGFVMRAVRFYMVEDDPT